MMTSAREPALQTLLSRTFPGEHGPIIAPTLYLALYVDPVQPEEVRDFLDRSKQVLGAHLRFYQTGSMKEPAPLNDTKLAQWLDKKLVPNKRLDIHTLMLNERGNDGVTPAAITINVESLRIEPLTDAQRRRDDFKRIAKAQNGAVLTAGAFLLAAFPLDDAVAEPGAFIAWLKQLRVVTGGRVICGSAGVALNLAVDVHGRDATDQHELAHGLLARHPGLDLLPTFGQRVLRMSADGVVQPRIRRASWLNLISEPVIDELGGVQAVEARLKGTAARLERLDDRAWLLQASPMPRIGDSSVGDRVSEYAAVGRLLRPVRAEELAASDLSYSLDWRDRWHSAFDGEELA
jgi:hypothetical protein